MIKASLQAVFNRAHNAEYQFFREYDCVDGWAVIIGFNEGQPLTSFRLFNERLQIVLFEQDLFLEEKIKSAKWVLRQDFEYHITALSETQEAQTLFIPKKNKKLLTHQATFVEQEVADLLEKGYKLRARRVAESDTDSTTITQAAPDTGTNPFVKQIGFVTQPLDNFNLAPHLIIVEDLQIKTNFLKGALKTLSRNKPTVMLPNNLPLLIDSGETLTRMNYRPYVYNPREDILQPFRDEAKAQSVFFVHQSIFNSEKPVKLRP